MKAANTFILLITILLLYACLIWVTQDSVLKIPKNLHKYLMYDELPISELVDVDALKHKVREANMRREVANWKKFGPLIKETTIIVVQVHQNIRGLQYLIISLAQVRHIQSVLLVFSHSYYSEHFHRLIRRINFCKVMQIYYPHSIQLHPNKFPGIDPEDCLNGSQTTLRHCSQRDASSVERKHHWWWKANFIFDQMEWSLAHTGTVIFLDEDQYVAPDLLHMLRYLQRSLSYFPGVEIMSLGTIYARNLDHRLVTMQYWRPPFDVGIAFNRTTWNKIIDLSSFYCMYDDTSWSYSLLNVFKNFPKGNIDTVTCVAPRVIATKQFDNVDDAVVEISREFLRSQLFPEKVKTVFLFGPRGRVDFDIKAPPKGNGGWSNIQDQLLCLDTLNPNEGYEATAMTSRFDQYTD